MTYNRDDPRFPGATLDQIRILEMRSYAERTIRRSMEASGSTPQEIEDFIQENLPHPTDVIVQVFGPLGSYTKKSPFFRQTEV